MSKKEKEIMKKKMDNVLIKGAVKANEVKNKVLSKKRGSDDIIYKAGFIGVAFVGIVLWKTGVLGIIKDFITNMTTQAANFFTE